MKKILNILLILLIFSLIFISYCFASTGTLRDTEFLNVRETPSTSSNIVTVLPKDASFEIIEEEGDWYKIKYQDFSGYVSKQYVSIKETVANTSIPPKANSNGIVNKDSKLYILPLLNSTVLENITANTDALVVSINGKWAYIQTDTNSGWIFLDNINGTDTATTNNDYINDNENNSNVDKNNIEDSNTDSNNNTATNEVDNENINNSNSNNDVTSNEDNNSNNIQNEISSNYPKTMYVNVDAVYIRSQATTSSDTVASVGLNTPVTVNGEEGDWYKVNVTDGSGYMMKKYLSETKQ